MSLDLILQAVPSEFNIKEFLNLSTLHKDADLYRTLKLLKETEFKEFTRLVFYHIDPLVYAFDDLPSDSLINLQKMLVYIGIPNYYCLFVSNDKKVKEGLKYVCEQYAFNEHPIEFICLK
jgi:hypothetical protein